MGNLKGASARVANLPLSAIHEMTRLSKTVDDVAFFSWAKPTSPAPEHIHEAVIEKIASGAADGYSQSSGLLELREEIAKKLSDYNGIDAKPSEIIVTIGAIEGLQAAVLAAAEPGDEVILPSPTYSTHITQVEIAGAKPVFVPSVEEDGWRLDIDGVRKAVTPRTKAIIYCSPVNPTGAVFSEEELRELAGIAVDNGLAVITDEAYEYFTFDGVPHFSIGSIPEMKENAVSCFTFTKSYAMTGWRIGYLHASEYWIKHIEKAHIPMAICSPVASQYAALAALQGPQDCIADFQAKYLAQRNLMLERLDRMKSVFSCQKPAGSYLMFPKILLPEGADSGRFCKDLLLNAKVSTTPGGDFGPTAEGHLRMSFCVGEDTINLAFDRMEEYFKEYL